MTYGSCQSRCESKVQTWLNPWVSAWRASSTTREAGGFVCNTTPTSIEPVSLNSFSCVPDGLAAVGSAEVLGQAALDVGAVPGPAVEGATVDDHAAPGEHGVDVAVDLEALPGRVV